MKDISTTPTTTKLVPLHIADKVEALIKKLNRRAERNDFDLIEFSRGKTGLLHFIRVSDGDSEKTSLISKERYDKINKDTIKRENEYRTTGIMGEDKGDAERNTFVMEGIEVTVTADVEHSHDGYRLVGCTKKQDDGIHLVHNFEEDKFDFEHLRGTCKCDHCGKDRERNDVYFVADEGDSIKLLGSSCVQLFFPNAQNPLDKFNFETEFRQILGDMGGACEEWYNGGNKAFVETVDKTLKIALHISEKDGWTSQGKANASEDVASTKDKVVSYVYSTLSNSPSDVTKRISNETLDSYSKEVEEIIEFARARKSDNSFFSNANEYISNGYVSPKNMGYVVGLIGWIKAHKNKIEKDELKAKNSDSEFISEVGEKKVAISGVVKSVKSFETVYGIRYLTILITNEGNVVKYFNEFKVRGQSVYGEAGDRVAFTATIKEHETFNGIKQTGISRPTKIEIEKVS